MSIQTRKQPQEPRTFVVAGRVRFVDDIPGFGFKVAAFDRDLRTEQTGPMKMKQDQFVRRLREAQINCRAGTYPTMQVPLHPCRRHRSWSAATSPRNLPGAVEGG
jgi:hypothetical protein